MTVKTYLIGSGRAIFHLPNDKFFSATQQRLKPIVASLKEGV